jgi:hypothetical protein
MVFLQREAELRHNRCVKAHQRSESARVRAQTGDSSFSFRLAFDESIGYGFFAKSPAYTGIRKIRTDEVNLRFTKTQVMASPV